MPFILSLLISFHLMISPVLAEVGEHKTFTPKQHLLNLVAENEAKHFETSMRSLFGQLERQGASSYIATLGDKLAPQDQKTFTSLFKQAGIDKFKLKEKNPGEWEFHSKGHKVSFALLNLHRKQIKINDKIFDFNRVSYSQLENALNAFETPASTSLLRQIFEKSLGIESAHALGPFMIIVALVAAVVLGMAVYEIKYKPEKVAERLSELQNKLDQDASTCQEARTDERKYQATFALAESVSERSSLNSATSAASVLELALKTQLQSGNRNDEDCYRLMNEAGNQLDVEIPIPTANQISRNEAGMNSGRVASATMNLCRAYNALGSCMASFVASHVNDNSIDTFRQEAVPNLRRFQRSGTSRQ